MNIYKYLYYFKSFYTITSKINNWKLQRIIIMYEYTNAILCRFDEFGIQQNYF